MGFYYDGDLSQAEHDEIFYVGTRLALLHLEGPFEGDWTSAVDLEAGVLVGLGGSTDVQLALKFERMGPWEVGGVEEMPAYNRYLVKLGFLHFPGQ